MALERLGLEVTILGLRALAVDGAVNEETHNRIEYLEKAGVALTPGIDFGDRGEGHLRISYANSLDNIKEGMDRLEKYLDERGNG